MTISISARNANKAFYSWFIATRERVNGKYIVLWAPNVATESNDRAVTTPTHPIDRSAAIIDDAIIGTMNYQVSLVYNTSLQNDRLQTQLADPFDVLFTGDPNTYTVYPPTQELFVEEGDPSLTFLTFAAFAREGMLKIQGLPVDIYSPKFGFLENFIMTGYGDQRGLASEANIQLSFTKRRVSESQTAFIDTDFIGQRGVGGGRSPSAEVQNDEDRAGSVGGESGFGRTTTLKANWNAGTFGKLGDAVGGAVSGIFGGGG